MFNLKTDTIIILQIFVILLLILLIKDKVEGYKVEGFADTTQDPPAFIQFIKGVDPILSLNTNDLDDANYTKFTKDDMTPSDITGNFFNYEILKKKTPSFNANDINKIKVTSDSIPSNYWIIFYQGKNFDNDDISYSSTISSTDPINIELDDLIIKPFSFKIFSIYDNMEHELQREANDYNQILLFNSRNYYGEIIRLPVKLTPEGSPLPLDKFISNNKSILSIKFPGSSDNTDSDFRNIKLELINEETPETTKEITDYTDLSVDLNNYTHYKITPQVSTLETQLANTILTDNIKELNTLKDIINEDLTDYVEDTKYNNKKDDFMNNMSINIVDDMQKKINGFHYDLSNYKLYPI